MAPIYPSLTQSPSPPKHPISIECIESASEISCSEDTPESNYGRYVEASLSCHFPRFVENFKDPSYSTRNSGRVAMLTFAPGQPASAVNFSGSKELTAYLDSTHSIGSLEIRRRLFILEGLPRNYIEALGSRLKVPPAFFAAQWAAMLPDGWRYSLGMEWKDRFIIKYAQPYNLGIGCSSKMFEDEARAAYPTIERYIHFSRDNLLSEGQQYAGCCRVLSYWSKKYFESSWDAIILTDPPVSEVAVTSSFEAPLVKFVQLIPDTNQCPPLDTKTYFWNGHDQAYSGILPSYTSMLDDIVRLHADKLHLVDESAITCTVTCRKLAAACTIGYLRRLQLHIMRGVKLERNQSPYINSFWENDLVAPWSSNTAASLDMARFVLNRFLYECAKNVRTLGMDPTDMEKPLLDVNQDWERSSYNEILNSVNFLLKVVDMFTQTYHQQGAIYEAKRANDIAKSVAKITLLVSVFFPISITASIFSMGGEYLPGSRLF